jgi:hypothetical protein
MLWFNSVGFLTLGFNFSQAVSVRCKRGARSVVQDARLGRVSSRSKTITSSDVQGDALHLIKTRNNQEEFFSP